MKQVLQSLRNGATEVAEVPCPAVRQGQVLIRTSRSLISAGTERMLVDFGKAGWLDKARQQPDKVRMALDKAKTDGIISTIEAIFHKLGQPLPLGYCNVGTVVDVGAGATGFSIGDRVASNGKHAEVVTVPANLCAAIPMNVSDDEAAFTVIGAIALEGIRLVQPTLGEAVVVTGLGLVGLMTVQLLRAHGCRVLGIDVDARRVELARQFGADAVDLGSGSDPLIAAKVFSRGRGVDAVILTAATDSSEPVHQAALMCRKRGRIVLVGVTGLELSRADFYEKELTLQVSCSYGPGRHDRRYEEEGVDYPIGFVRWTEQRNFEAVLDMLNDRRLDVSPLISHRFHIDAAERAYSLLATRAPSLGILLDYAPSSEITDGALRRPDMKVSPIRTAVGAPSVAVVGAGNHAAGILIPALDQAGANLRIVVSANGISGVQVARKFRFEETTTDAESAIVDDRIDTVVIATRHDSHADFAMRALSAGKHVFVEKPLAMTLAHLAQLEMAATCHGAAAPPLLTVGFNRRFAPQAQKMRALLSGIAEPKAVVIMINAGSIPTDHWTQDPSSGGGRIVGEVCHFIDLLRYLVGSPFAGYHATSLRRANPTVMNDNATIVFRFEDGSIGTIHYLPNGHKSFPKERVEVFAAGRILQLDNYRVLRGFGWPDFSTMKLWRQDKGHKACAAAFVEAVKRGGPAPIAIDELFEVSRASIDIANLLNGTAARSTIS